MKRTLLFFIPIALIIGACNQTNQKEVMTNENPFFVEYTTPYQVPPFEQIENEDYLPAFEEGIKRNEEEIKAITENEETPTFENTILAFDRSGKMLDDVSAVFFNILSADSNEDLQQIARDVTPLITDHENNIMLDQVLYERVKVVYNSRLDSNLDPQQIRLVEKYYQDFVRSGAGLNEDEKERMREINNELSMLNLEFGDNLLAETSSGYKLIIENEENLSGLPQEMIDAAAELATQLEMTGKWVFQPSMGTMVVFLQYADNRDMREQLYRGYFMRSNNDNDKDNKELIKQIAEKRAEKAEMLGFSNHAEYVIDVNMAETPEAVFSFLNKLWTSALPVAKNELKEMQAIADREGADFELASWDWFYYAEKLRKEKYDIDESEIKPYLQLENVREGMFWVAGQLYGIEFSKLDDVPVYHPDVEVFEVTEADGTLIGLLYFDYFARDSKRGGAWCTGFREASYDDEGKRIEPLVSIVLNYPKATGDALTLLSWDETTTMFHEFGHALHGLFTDGLYARTAGVVPRDYVELPSQIMENFAGEPEVLKHYAIHFETGDPMPDELIEKINNSGHFNQGFGTVEYLAASLLDLEWHAINSSFEVADVGGFEKTAMDKIGLIDEILPRYRSTYFQHIFSGGYSAGYYVYIWAAVLDADAFNAFKTSGDIFNQDLADKFRKYCLSEVGDAPAMEQYVKFRGQQPDEEPLLNRRGLK